MFFLATPIIVLALLAVQSDASCVIPSDLQGAWVASGRPGTLTFTSSMLVGLSLEQFPNIVFNCHTNIGDKYVFRSNTVTLFAEQVKIYFCLDFERTSGSSYEMYELTNKVGLYYEDRARAFLISDDPGVTMSDVCQLTRQEVKSKTIKRL